MLANQKVSRFQLLRRGLGNDGKEGLRPPFAVSSTDFLDLCDRSGRCLEACPEGIIVRGSGKFPEIDFSRGECTFCLDCVKVCQSGALNKAGALDKKALNFSEVEPWSYKAVIDSACLSANGVTCRVCGDICDTRAIKFRLAVGGKAFPELTVTDCTGCGACVAPCPTKSITIEIPTIEELERRENA